MEEKVNKKFNLNLLNKDEYKNLLGFRFDLCDNSSLKQIYDKDSVLLSSQN
jgi:hypothetical protein